MKGREARPHIGIFGRRNQGKSSLINVLGGQEIAIVSEIPGTTTDPVKKSIEIPGIGPVVLIDTAGMDDSGELGEKRKGKSRDIMKIIDLAVLMISDSLIGEEEKQIIGEFRNWEVPFFFVHNKSDLKSLSPELRDTLETAYRVPLLEFSCKRPENKEELVDTLRKNIPASAWKSTSLIGDIISAGDLVLLITPIDAEAPEGRLILPQVQAIRDILDNDAIAVVVKEREVDALIRQLSPRPALVITDSQVFQKADASIPDDIPLTSFSTVLARYKGDFEAYLEGTPFLDRLQDDDQILILESCTHHVSCDDIGRVKIPRWLSNYSGKSLKFQVVSGLDKVPGEMTDYAMVIQCGGCMITRKQLINRLKPAREAGIPVTNYGMAIAWMHGIYNRAIAPFVRTGEEDVNYL
jgi:[FeFe] hydrogenase H-cluster maturation GTPase HydF